MNGYVSRSTSRRRFLGVVGTGVPVGVTGCLGGTGDDGNDDGDGEHQYATDVEHPGDEPLEFTGEYVCPVCNMIPADYPTWRCQLAHEDGQGALFDTPGCLFAYYAAPPTDAEITAAWVTDFESEALVDGFEASYVLVTDDAAVPEETMGINPRPFENREDAVAYLDEWDAEDLTEDDVVELTDVDREIAAIYRGNRLPDE
ncbi:nitrous oxide reductase accessory protein NosL [Halosolutus amylolyticus]|uniref:Nitrous oxide reductase accessory protein NosL n=1 Tax=Halosolutus amylolyticus TaxID=2932267 RepID=A0ABD5PVX6_9EURY|nr:nitrous oxide reductase accessory protein NosL [Halosolutus amylolyticus]